MATEESITATVLKLPDEQLQEWLDMARMDLEQAAKAEPDSDWHQSCFSAVYLICQELNRRGIKGPDPVTFH